MPEKINLLLFLTSFLVGFNAARAEQIVLNGRMSLWTASPCADGSGLCGLPTPLAPSWSVRIEFTKPDGIGHFKVTDRHFTSGDWVIRLYQFIRTSLVPGESYLMTQVALSKAGEGLIALCSRYDAVDAFSFLPPGACVGREGDRMIGVSLIRD